MSALLPFVRIPAPEGEQRSQRRQREERESDVWIRQVQAPGIPEPTSRWVHVGDRGADMFPFFHAGHATHFLVRAAQNRRVEESEEGITYALDRARSRPSQGSRALALPARHGHPARSAQLQLACGQMTLLPPRARAASQQGALDRLGHSRLGRASSRRGEASAIPAASLGAHHHA